MNLPESVDPQTWQRPLPRADLRDVVALVGEDMLVAVERALAALGEAPARLPATS